MNSILGWATEPVTPEQVRQLYTLMARTVVPPQEFWVPLSLKPDTWGQGIARNKLASSLLSGSKVEDAWGPAWDRLDAQVGLCLSSLNLPAAAFYAMHMLGLSDHYRSIVWEGPPGRSRMWVKQKSWVTPLPLKSATEGVLWTWWALSGGFHNFSRRLLPVPDYDIGLFPHHRPEDRDALQQHPSKTVWQEVQWVGARHGEDFRDVFGVLYDETGAVREGSDGPSPFDWRTFPTVSHGLFWLDGCAHSLGPQLHQYATEWRLAMSPPDSGEEPEA